MAALLLLLTACNDISPPVQSTPVQEDGPVQIELGPPVAVKDPVSPEELSTAYPELSTLPNYPLLAVVGTLNLVPGPCVPCSTSLARCALDLPKGCENLPGLVARAISLAGEGKNPDELRVALSYPDVWFNDPTSEQTDAVDIEVWVDPSAPSVPGILERMNTLKSAVGEIPLRFHIRVLWNDDAEDERPAALALLAAEEQSAGLAFLTAGSVAAGAIPEPQVFTARTIDPGLDTLLESELVVSQTKGVRSAPTWFVEGYRLRGLQSTQSISHLAVLAWEDLRLASSVQEIVTP
jgi:hypothetical protein